MSYPVTRRRFTVAEYHQMIDAGILGEDDRVELIDGEIVEMSAISSRRAAGVRRISKLFERRLNESALVSVQNPIRLSNFHEPEPDIALLKPREDFYAQAHPKPDDVLLVVEVAESSAVKDRIVKTPAYAQALIAELWIVDLEQELIEVYADLAGEAYRFNRQMGRGQTLAPRALPSATLKADEVLG